MQVLLVGGQARVTSSLHPMIKDLHLDRRAIQNISISVQLTMATMFGSPVRSHDAGARCLRERNPWFATSSAKPEKCPHDGSAAINVGTPRTYDNKMVNPFLVDGNNRGTPPPPLVGDSLSGVVLAANTLVRRNYGRQG